MKLNTPVNKYQNLPNVYSVNTAELLISSTYLMF